MYKHIDLVEWSEMVAKPDWYFDFMPRYKALVKQGEEEGKDIADEIKEELYQFFEERLRDGSVALGIVGEDWDRERRAIGTIIIHHTKNKPGITWERLSAMHLVRLYATYYASPHYSGEAHVKGEPIYSHHFRADGTQVFYAYHWLVRMDGSCERLLRDEEIGWQAGNWDVNCKSIAICLDNDYNESTPSQVVLQAIADIIRAHYADVPLDRILGHREVNLKTVCPGEKFLSEWREKILGLL